MSISQYLAELKNVQLLSPEEEGSLWRAYKQAGDLDARSQLIERYQPLVFKAAMRWRVAESAEMDIIQEGTIGLIEAAENYDHTRGVAFSVYALHRICGRIANFVEREGKLNWLYIDSPLAGHEEQLTLGDCLEDMGTGVAIQAEQNFLLEQVKTAFGRLPTNEQLVLNGMYLNEQEPKQLAETLDLSVSHIYRLQKQGVRRVRGMLSKLMQEMKGAW